MCPLEPNRLNSNSVYQRLLGVIKPMSTHLLVLSLVGRWLVRLGADNEWIIPAPPAHTHSLSSLPRFDVHRELQGRVSYTRRRAGRGSGCGVGGENHKHTCPTSSSKSTFSLHEGWGYSGQSWMPFSTLAEHSCSGVTVPRLRTLGQAVDTAALPLRGPHIA